MKYHQQFCYVPIVIVLLLTPGLMFRAYGKDQKTYTIGVINLAPALDGIVEGFKEDMTESGYLEGENTIYMYEGATNSIEKLDAVAQGLVAANVDLILSVTTPATLAAQRATAGTNIPVVFVPVNDPVEAGIVKSLRNPDGNITGVTFGAQEGRRLEWFVQIVPTIQAVYIPYNPEDQSAVVSLKAVSDIAPKLGVALITREVRTPEEIPTAIENIPEEADAIFLLADSLLGGRANKFAELQLPTSAANPEDLKIHGVLTSYGIDQISSGKQAARLADQILRGVKPADLPVEMAEFYLAINLKTAEALGLDIPDEILLQAGIIVR